MKVILMGLHGDASTQSVSEGLTPFFHVRHVELVDQANSGNPWAVIDIDNSYEHVWDMCNRLRGVFHRGKALHLYIPLHQNDIYHEIPAHQRIDIG